MSEFNDTNDKADTTPTVISAKGIFDNLPDWISPDQVTKLYPISRDTVYDWHYRPRKYQIPAGLLKKFGRRLFIRRDTLENWVNSRNV